MEAAPETSVATLRRRNRIARVVVAVGMGAIGWLGIHQLANQAHEQSPQEQISPSGVMAGEWANDLDATAIYAALLPISIVAVQEVGRAIQRSRNS